MVTVSGNSNPTYPTNPTNPTNPTTINSGELTDKNQHFRLISNFCGVNKIRLKQADFYKICLTEKNFWPISGLAEFYESTKIHQRLNQHSPSHNKFGW